MVSALGSIEATVGLVRNRRVPRRAKSDAATTTGVRSVVGDNSRSLVELKFSNGARLSIQSLGRTSSHYLVRVSSLLPRLCAGVTIRTSPGDRCFVHVACGSKTVVVSRIGRVSSDALLPSGPTSGGKLELRARQVRSRKKTIGASSRSKA